MKKLLIYLITLTYYFNTFASQVANDGSPHQPNEIDRLLSIKYFQNEEILEQRLLELCSSYFDPNLDPNALFKLLDKHVNQNPKYFANRTTNLPIEAFVEKLLQNNPHFVNHQKPSGETALHIAAFWRMRKICQLLLYYGANPTLKDRWNRTPLSIANNPNTNYLGDHNVKDILEEKKDFPPLTQLDRAICPKHIASEEI